MSIAVRPKIAPPRQAGPSLRSLSLKGDSPFISASLAQSIPAIGPIATNSAVNLRDANRQSVSIGFEKRPWIGVQNCPPRWESRRGVGGGAMP